MDRGRHHFVPQFYLRAFACAPKRINALHLKSGRVLERVPIRTQCARENFHAPYEGLEANLSRVETLASQAIRRVRETGRLPVPGSEDDAALRAFVAVQASRTTRAAREASEMSEAMMKIHAGPDLARHGVDPDAFRIELTEPLRMTMAPLESTLRYSEDLRLHLVRSGGHGRFVTSDAPVFKYNLFCEGVQLVGTVGVAQAGFLEFLPISPDHLLVLADPVAYKLGRRGGSISECASPRDVEQLNAMQAIVAEEVLLAAGTEELARFAPLPRQTIAQREVYRPEVRLAVGVDNPREGLVHFLAPVPNLKLDLSFLSVRKGVRGIPLEERPRIYRHEPPKRPMPPGFGRGSKEYRALTPGERPPWLESTEKPKPFDVKDGARRARNRGRK